MGWMMVLFAIAVGGLLIWQNLAVITLVFFGGIMTVKLPLAVWVLLFTLAGIISGLTLQFLYSFGRPVAAPKASPRIANNPTVPPPSPRPTYIQDSAPSPPLRRSSGQASNDWERDSGDDWNFDTPPLRRSSGQAEKPTTIQDREEFSPRVADGERVDFVKPPSDSSRTGSVYSYSYRTAKQTRGEKADQVYDVNYRIITPPAQDQNQDREVNKGDEEEWI
ncbi:Lipopolysaccharide assembly protein A domain-containing protein [Microcystis aeruginosa]